MPDNLRLYHPILAHMQRFLPTERITRLRNLSLLMMGLFLARKVHLSHIVRKWPLRARLPSLTNRLRRFLDNPRLDPPRLYRPVARLLIGSLEAAEAPLRLILDTTKLGFRHRLLRVSLAYGRRALPLAWSVHSGRKGHVKVVAQKRLLGRVEPLISPEAEVLVLGDSAFGQVALMRYVRQRRWHFVLRSCGHYQVRGAATGSTWQALCRMALEEGQTRFVGAVSFTERHAFAGVFLVMPCKGEEEPWYLMASRPVSPQTLRHYRVRMWTEALYGDLKGHGFDLEATHLGEARRLERLVLSVCLVYVWLIVLGRVVVSQGLRSLVDRRSRRDKSYFRIGWDYLEHRLRLGQPIPLRFSLYP